MSKRVITFGEIMLRLAPNGYYRFFQNDQMQATFGGGEANVAVSLANYGLDSAYVTKLPSHASTGCGGFPAVFRGGHLHDHPRRRPRGDLLLGKGRLAARKRLHL